MGEGLIVKRVVTIEIEADTQEELDAATDFIQRAVADVDSLPTQASAEIVSVEG